MSLIGVSVLAGIGACVGLGATAPVAARRAYLKARARAAQRVTPLALAHEVMIPVRIERKSMVRVDFRQLAPEHISRPHHVMADVDVASRDSLPPARIIEVPIEVERIVYKALPEDLSTYVTIVEVMRRLGVEITNEKTWALGREARKLHVAQYGVPPRKVLRQKTNGTGSHDFSGYPPEFVGVVEGLIQQSEAA